MAVCSTDRRDSGWIDIRKNQLKKTTPSVVVVVFDREFSGIIIIRQSVKKVEKEKKEEEGAAVQKIETSPRAFLFPSPVMSASFIHVLGHEPIRKDRPHWHLAAGPPLPMRRFEDTHDPQI